MKKYLTLMFISHNKGYIKEHHLSKPKFIGIVSTLCLLLLLALGYVATIGKRERLAELKAENTALQREFALIQEELKNMRHNMDQLQEKDRIMRAWVDLSEPSDEVRQIGVGGGEAIPSEWETAVPDRVSGLLADNRINMDQLLREAHFLQASFDTILTVLSKDIQMRRHIPSITPVRMDNPRISSGFGIRRDPFTGRRQFHSGIDYPGRRGTPIIATADGTIDKIDYNHRLGWYVRINHGYGLQTLYGHLNRKPHVKLGTRVKRGEKIGEMGRTGRSTAPHLHYSVIKNGNSENPTHYIFDQKTRSLF
ncbi:MAG: M23 family metallopeptidase [Gemmatimonadota bacterium]|nr:M23 family metallopeptidase [Gemmatimonadota bacterium]MDE2954216.1 M23 family metallopeptidase [Gemmatimonadota bacterium]